MKITREFEPASRYTYDFDLCSSKNGFAQMDTRQDASYFGCWANPFKLITFEYCEGDCITVECADESEFQAQINKIVTFHNQTSRFVGIDPGFNQELRQKFESLGFNHLLH